MMYLALSYDHRVVDGKEAVTFLVRVKEALEDPARLVLDLVGCCRAWPCPDDVSLNEEAASIHRSSQSPVPSTCVPSRLLSRILTAMKGVLSTLLEAASIAEKAKVFLFRLGSIASSHFMAVEN